MNCSDVAAIVGRRQLFVGVESYQWTPLMFAGVAQFARVHGIDTLLVKVADGGNVWYGGLAGYRQRRDAVKGEGVGVVPYIYSYGDKFKALDREIDILIEYIKEDRVACMDAEAEWNNQAAWAAHLCARLQGTQGHLLVSTWGNPVQQGWGNVIKAMSPVVAAWMPQQYTNYLASCWGQFADLGAACLVPTVDLSDGFGPNDPAAIAAAAHNQGHAAISVWYHATAMNNPALLDEVLATFPRNSSEEGDMPLPWNNPLITAYFTKISDTLLRCNSTPIDLHDAMLDYWRRTQGALRLPITNEIYGIIPGVSFQVFEGGVLAYDPQRLFDDPPVQGDVYAMHLDADTPGLRQLIARAGLALSQDALPAGRIEAARSSIDSSVFALEASLAGLRAAQQDLLPAAAISVVATK